MKLAATTKVQSAVSSTGVHDSASASILESLIELGKKLRKRGPGLTATSGGEITAALEKEFDELLRGTTLNDAMNPLLGMNGKLGQCHSYHAHNIVSQGSTSTWICRLKSSIQYCWAW
jgi:hypothetical protein